MKLVVTNRTEAGVERVLQTVDVQMPMWGDLGLRKVFRSLELTAATCGAEHQKRQMRHTTRSQARIRQMEFEPRRQCFVEGAVWIGGSLVIFVRQKVTTSGIVQFWQKSCKLEATPQVVVRSDGEPALLAHVKAARAMTLVSDVPLELVHEQVSKEQSPGNGLAELKAKIRTLRHSTEMGLGRRIPETHDSLAWFVTHAAATINWFRPGFDGKTPYEQRVGRKFRRPVGSMGVDECREARESHQR